MLVRRGLREYLFTIVIVRYFSATSGIAIYNKDKDLTNEEKRGAAEEVKNELLLSGETSPRANTEKRGIWDIGSNNDHYGGGPPRPSGLSHYGGYQPNRYPEDEYPHIYSHTGIGSSIPSGPGYYGERPLHSYGYPEDGHRPINYGSEYGGGYEEGHHYQEHGSGGDGHGIGGFKTLALKKILLPLAGLAILGVAAVASQHPILLQLGVANGRKRRSALPPEIYPPNFKVRPRKKSLK